MSKVRCISKVSFIHKQKFNISELVELDRPHRHVLVIEPEYYLRHVYSRHLISNGFSSSLCENFSDASGILHLTSPDLIVWSLPEEREMHDHFKSLAWMGREFPYLPVISIGRALSRQALSKLMSHGVVSHLERRLTRPADIIAVIKTILV